jgi:hypothetical protein
MTQTGCLSVSFLLIVLTGCGDEASSQKPSAALEPADGAKASANCAVLFVNNWKLSPSHGCYVTNLGSSVQSDGELMCGPTEESTRLRHRWTGRTVSGDSYELKWDFYPDRAPPKSEVPLPTTIQKTVSFHGQTVVAMENERQRVILYPCGAAHPPAVDQSTPRSP